MKMSEQLTNLGKALAAFNAEVQKVIVDARNPQFRSKYVTLDALIDATKPILQKHGLSVLQFPLTSEDGKTGVKSMLLHESGEFIESDALFMQPVRMVKGGAYEQAPDPQAAGSTISYLRRYSYQAILNLSTGEDDDAEKAVGRGNDSARTNTSEPSQERQSRRERTETSDTKEESSENNAAQPNESTETHRRGSRRGNSETTNEQAAESTTQETSRRGSRRGSEDTSSDNQSEQPRRGSRRNRD